MPVQKWRSIHPQLVYRPIVARERDHGSLGSSRTNPTIHTPPPTRLVIPIDDSPYIRLAPFLQQAVDFMQNAIASDPNDEAVVLVHCFQGVSRGPTVVMAYLIDALGLSVDEAYAMVKAARPKVLPNPGFMRQLRLWEDGRRERIAPRDERKAITDCELGGDNRDGM
jgi:protein-tyrosine phosphatase